jgi:hypothetical protein
MTTRYGRAPRGERVMGTAPRNHGKNTTLFAALSLDGITVAMTVEGALDRPAFDAFVDQVLAPSLRPGQIVIWDNLSVHKSATAQQVITAAGCHLLWLPRIHRIAPRRTGVQQVESTLAADRRPHPRGLRGGENDRSRLYHRHRCPRMVRPCWRPTPGSSALTTALIR